MKLRLPLILLFSTLALAALTAAANPTKVARSASKKIEYPSEYRSWTHVKSMWLSKKHGLAQPFAGLHHIYANESAADALRRGRPMPDNSVFVFDLFAASPKAEAMREGDRKLVGVMQKNRRAFSKTGGWGFEAFAGDSKTKRIVKDGGVSCFSCHLSRKGQGYVFTEWRD